MRTVCPFSLIIGGNVAPIMLFTWLDFGKDPCKLNLFELNQIFSNWSFFNQTLSNQIFFNRTPNLFEPNLFEPNLGVGGLWDHGGVGRCRVRGDFRRCADDTSSYERFIYFVVLWRTNQHHVHADVLGLISIMLMLTILKIQYACLSIWTFSIRKVQLLRELIHSCGCFNF